MSAKSGTGMAKMPNGKDTIMNGKQLLNLMFPSGHYNPARRWDGFLRNELLVRVSAAQSHQLLRLIFPLRSGWQSSLALSLVNCGSRLNHIPEAPLRGVMRKRTE